MQAGKRTCDRNKWAVVEAIKRWKLALPFGEIIPEPVKQTAVPRLPFLPGFSREIIFSLFVGTTNQAWHAG